MNTSDLTVVPTLQIPADNSVDSHLVFRKYNNRLHETFIFKF